MTGEPATTVARADHVRARGTSVLEVQDLHVGFKDRTGQIAPAVTGLSLDVPHRRSVALVGESGSGKTGSMRAILGLLPSNAHVTGEAWFGGRDLLSLTESDLRKVRGSEVGMVFQNAMDALNPTRTLKVQLTEHLRWHGLCDRKDALRRAVETLDRVGIPEPHRRVRMYPFQLSGGMRQRAMIAMAMVAEPKLLIADEPTTALDVTIQRQVLDVLKTLRNDGVSIVMITHDLGVARYFCDDIVVMRHGNVVEAAPMRQFITTAAEPYSRQLLDAAIDVDLSADEHAGLVDDQPSVSADEVGPTPVAVASRAELLQARDLVKTFQGRGGDVPAVAGVTLTIGKGETVGVVGESGSGKSTLARLLMRLIEPTSGSVTFDGRDLFAASGSELRGLRKRIQMIFQNPHGSLSPHQTIAANIMEPLRVHGVGTVAHQRAQALELLDLVGVPAERADQYPRQFSGGQQQRIAIARALALEPDVLVCDEPTSALDVSIQAQILELLQSIQDRLGLSMLFITHNLAVAQKLCDRTMVMAEGRVVESAPTTHLFTFPQHSYTQALIGAVLPVRSESLAWHQDSSIPVTAGDLVEVSRGHWVRRNLDVQ